MFPLQVLEKKNYMQERRHIQTTLSTLSVRNNTIGQSVG